jgi:hypothetical protein
MASFQETLVQVLGDDATLTELLAGRLYPGEIPDEEAPTPWVFYQVPESVPFEDLDADGDARHQVEFHALADSYAEAKAISDAIVGALNGYSGGQITRAFWEGTSEEETESGFHHAVRFTIWGTVATIVGSPANLPKITTAAGSVTIQAGGHTLTLSSSGLLLDGSAVGSGGGSGNLDGGTPSSVYGGTSPVDGGTP